jgi:hypothetical protein
MIDSCEHCNETPHMQGVSGILLHGVTQLHVSLFAVNLPSEKKYPSWNVKFPSVYEILMGPVKRTITKLC